MNQREYESALKDLLEQVAYRLEYYEPNFLDELKMPQNVPGVPRISVTKWLDARWTKRNYPKGPQ